MMRKVAQILILGTPAQSAKGAQMLIDAAQPLPCELAAAERKRLFDVIDQSGVDEATRARAKIAVEIGATAQHVLEVLYPPIKPAR